MPKNKAMVKHKYICKRNHSMLLTILTAMMLTLILCSTIGEGFGQTDLIIISTTSGNKMGKNNEQNLELLVDKRVEHISKFQEYNENKLFGRLNTALYTLHEPIVINNDTDFELYNFPGNGTKTSPYIIEYLNITNINSTENEKEGIAIRYVTKYFVIRNCFIKGWSTGIHLYTLKPGIVTLIGNILTENTQYSLFLETKTGAVIRDNLFIKANNNDIFSSYNVILYNNTFLNIDPSSDYALLIHGGNNVTIEMNKFINTGLGLRLYWLNNASVINNYFYNNSQNPHGEGGGILYDGGYNITFKNNYFNMSGFSFSSDDTLSYSIASCIFENNTINNLPLGLFVHVNNFTINKPYGQILLLNCSYVVVTNQQISFAFHGIYTDWRTSYVDIVNSTFSYNLGAAIFLQSYGAHIINNSFIENTIGLCGGINGIVFKHTVIRWNTFFNNSIAAIKTEDTYMSFCYLNNFLFNGWQSDYQVICDYEGESLTFYNPDNNKGNYWSDWEGQGSYLVYPPDVIDPFPLTSMVPPYNGTFQFYHPSTTVSTPSFWDELPLPFIFSFASLLFAIPILIIFIRRIILSRSRSS